MRSNRAQRLITRCFFLAVSLYFPFCSVAAPTIDLIAPQGISKSSRQLVLGAEADPLWQGARVDWLTVRSVAGQRSIAAKQLSKARPIEFDFTEQGCVLLLLDLAPAVSAKHEGRLSRSSKRVSCRFVESSADTLAARRKASRVLTSKVGSRIELRPLLNPAVLKIGSDLPLRAYFEGSSARNVELLVMPEDGSERRVTTDSVGIAAIPLDQPGRWVVSFERRAVGASAPSVAELVFEVLDDAAWQLLSAEGK